PSHFFPYTTLFRSPAVSTDPGSDLVSIAQQALLSAGVSSDDARPRGAQYFTDASVLQALGKNIIVLGPGDPKLAHQVNEHVHVNDYIAVIDIYDEILKKYMA